jgi:hypothetical protein
MRSRGLLGCGLGHDAVRVQGDLVMYRILRPLVACHDRRGPWLCTRAASHKGRHAQVLWEMDGRVRAVWGVRAAAEKTS